MILAARRPTTVVLISVCASPMSDLTLEREKIVDAPAVAWTLIVAFDW